ncbi:MAG: fibronectin type III domain-containing protein, partial [Bacteroidia bacterium]|nr:fibronectin type III domain-containing protein [Bacteroidia bacterium]
MFQTVMGQVLAPQLKCLATNTLGDVTLTWIPPADPGSQFFSYEIHYATVKAGPYSVIATVTPIGVNTYTHVGAAADVQSRFYYVVTKSGPSGTISSI